MLGVITCVCALHLAAALDIPLEGKSAPPDLPKNRLSTMGLTFVSKHLGGRGNFFFIFVHKGVKTFATSLQAVGRGGGVTERDRSC